MVFLMGWKGGQAEAGNNKEYSHFSFVHLNHVYIKRKICGAVEKREFFFFEILITTPPPFLSFFGLLPTRPYLLLCPGDQLRGF